MKLLYKTVTWRIIASSLTVLIVFFLTNRWDVAAVGGLSEILIKTAAYYVHERVWEGK